MANIAAVAALVLLVIITIPRAASSSAVGYYGWPYISVDWGSVLFTNKPRFTATADRVEYYDAATGNSVGIVSSGLMRCAGLVCIAVVPVAWWLDRFRSPRNVSCCSHCNYSLIGNTSGYCPECGHSISNTRRSGARVVPRFGSRWMGIAVCALFVVHVIAWISSMPSMFSILASSLKTSSSYRLREWLGSPSRVVICDTEWSDWDLLTFRFRGIEPPPKIAEEWVWERSRFWWSSAPRTEFRVSVYPDGRIANRRVFRDAHDTSVYWAAAGVSTIAVLLLLGCSSRIYRMTWTTAGMGRS